MEWLDQNIDAYRIVSEILGQLRATVRDGLEQVYGDKWYRRGLPSGVFDRLVAAKEREKAIDWSEDQYQQIMGYSTFADLIEILQMNAEHFPEFIALAPSDSLLHARFIELDMMRTKMGGARPISETELSFLATFHLRFIKAVAQSRDAFRAKIDEETPASETEPEPFDTINDTAQKPENKPADHGEVFVGVQVDPEVPGIQPIQSSPPREEDDAPSPPTRPVQTPAESLVTRTGGPSANLGEAEEGPVDQTVSPKDGRPVGPGDEVDRRAAPDEMTDGDSALPDPNADSNNRNRLLEALSTNDHLTVLREIYREVTAIAERVWNSEVTPNTTVWEQVTASDWYESNFSPLGLQPLSNFYEVTDKVNLMAKMGANKSEMQVFLSEANFAKTLLDLRDMFQANKI